MRSYTATVSMWSEPGNNRNPSAAASLHRPDDSRALQAGMRSETHTYIHTYIHALDNLMAYLVSLSSASKPQLIYINLRNPKYHQGVYVPGRASMRMYVCALVSSFVRSFVRYHWRALSRRAALARAAAPRHRALSWGDPRSTPGSRRTAPARPPPPQGDTRRTLSPLAPTPPPPSLHIQHTVVSGKKIHRMGISHTTGVIQTSYIYTHTHVYVYYRKFVC